jgi:hypothetical protein
MSHIKVKVRPKQTVRFPGICVHCTQPATESMQLKKRMGRATRLIQVPLCEPSAHTLKRRSADEERWQKIGLLVSGVVGLLILAMGLLFTPVAWGMGLRLLLAVGMSAVVVTAVITLTRLQQKRVMLPEKQAILKAAHIETFSWRATTFNFHNQAFLERFKTINKSLLMEN